MVLSAATRMLTPQPVRHLLQLSLKAQKEMRGSQKRKLQRRLKSQQLLKTLLQALQMIKDETQKFFWVFLFA